MALVNWLECNGDVFEELIQEIQDKIKVILPENYLNCIKHCDGGYPVKSIFSYMDLDHDCIWRTGIGVFLSINRSKFLENYIDPPEFFPKDIIAFAEVGNGDYICFDYRQGKDNINPPIVYWNHGADIGKDVSFIADNFEEFMNMLSEPDDLI